MPYKDKIKQAASANKHYIKNKKTMVARSMAFRKRAIKRNKDFVKSYLKVHPCIDCGNNDIRVLDFDHIKGTKFHSICKLSNDAYALKTIENEIKKCEVRCANCHRIQTYIRRLDAG